MFLTAKMKFFVYPLPISSWQCHRHRMIPKIILPDHSVSWFLGFYIGMRGQVPKKKGQRNIISSGDGHDGVFGHSSPIAIRWKKKIPNGTRPNLHSVFFSLQLVYNLLSWVCGGAKNHHHEKWIKTNQILIFPTTIPIPTTYYHMVLLSHNHNFWRSPPRQEEHPRA